LFIGDSLEKESLLHNIAFVWRCFSSQTMAKALLSILLLLEGGSLHKQPKNQSWVSLGFRVSSIMIIGSDSN
jgi:hypothetical protein